MLKRLNEALISGQPFTINGADLDGTEFFNRKLLAADDLGIVFEAAEGDDFTEHVDEVGLTWRRVLILTITWGKTDD